MEIQNKVDKNGNVTGGYVIGIGFDIQWQDGPVEDGKRNGALVEEVLEAAIQRIRAYQDTRLSCRENELAITKLEEAWHWLEARRRDRTFRSVVNTYAP